MFDLLVYGLIFINPMAPMLCSASCTRASKGMVPLVYVIGLMVVVAMLFTAFSYVLVFRFRGMQQYAKVDGVNGQASLLEATLGICTALCVLQLSAPAEAKAKFTVFDVESSDTFAYGINDLGVITGSGGFGKGFLRAVDGTITTFTPPSNFAVLFSRISGAGVVAGYYQDDQSNVRSFVRAADGTIMIVNVEGSESTVVYDINAGGTVTGAYGANRGSGFVQAADGTTTTFQVSNDITGGQAINDKGVVTGWYIDHSNVSHGFERAAGGRIKAFDAPGAGTGYGEGTQPVALNSASAITGWYVDSNALAHGFVRASDGRFAEFDPAGFNRHLCQ